VNNPPQVLIVEDDVTCRCWLRGLLKKLGYAIAGEAADGESALAAAARTKPDLVLLDVSMPVQTGPEVLPAILAASPGVRVIMLTSVADPAALMECLAKGAAGCIRKGSPVEEITRRLAELHPETRLSPEMEKRLPPPAE
jgi:two-component system, chemotaxis family, chemotaxis protein CheY